MTYICFAKWKTIIYMERNNKIFIDMGQGIYPPLNSKQQELFIEEPSNALVESLSQVGYPPSYKGYSLLKVYAIE